jgi:hypothetical protein
MPDLGEIDHVLALDGHAMGEDPAIVHDPLFHRKRGSGVCDASMDGPADRHEPIWLKGVGTGAAPDQRTGGITPAADPERAGCGEACLAVASIEASMSLTFSIIATDYTVR